jgi:hypothetical protein
VVDLDLKDVWGESDGEKGALHRGLKGQVGMVSERKGKKIWKKKKK